MIKIIKSGYTKKKPIVKFKCRCQCVYKTDEYEVGNQTMGIGYCEKFLSSVCPECGNFAYKIY